jgi:hypothetical protein
VTPDEAVVHVLEALDAAGISYMVVGSLASNIHGIPRSTRDADIVVTLEGPSLQALESHLAAGLTLQPQGAFETVTGTMRYLIELDGSAFVCELFLLSDDAHDRERFARRATVRAFGRAVSVATAEDTIITKLRWATDARRAKDRDDVRNILAVRAEELDWAYVERWTAAHGTTNLLAEIRASIPPM